MKPYLKLASTLVVIGMGMFAIERFGLGEFAGSGQLRFDPTLLSVMVIAPFAFILAGMGVFMYGKIRRL